MGTRDAAGQTPGEVWRTNNDKFDWRGCTFDRAADLHSIDDDGSDDDFDRQDLTEEDEDELMKEAHKKP